MVYRKITKERFDIMKIVKLLPAFKDYIWGGSKLKEGYNKASRLARIAESWELSCHPDGESVISGGEYDGRALASVIAENSEVLGTNCGGSGAFPLLIKLIDAGDDLSVQVHPGDEFAWEHEGQSGKTEMWYIIGHEDGACLYYGLKNDMTPEDFTASIRDGSVLDALNKVPVSDGDVFFIEPGTVHAIGKGIVLAEIQQSSNVTYRLYDYGRLAGGNPRELHIDKGVACAVLKPAAAREAPEGFLAACEYFSVMKRGVSESGYGYAAADSFHALLILSGNGHVDCAGERVEFAKGDTLFIPANAGSYKIEGDCETLVTFAGVPKPVYRVGADIGGTWVKCGAVDPENRIIARTVFSTEAEKGWADVVRRLGAALRSMFEAAGIPAALCAGIGIGCAGTIDSGNGVVLYSNNLRWKDAAVARELNKYLPLKVSMSNDANCAALGEAAAGAAKHVDNAVLLTLGTGLGGGIVLGGRIFEGAMPGGAELGHILTRSGHEQCTCGRSGCLEAHASATALYREAERALAMFPNSSMRGKDGALDKKSIFSAAAEGDMAAAGVVYNYLVALAEGITDIVNIFRPEMIVLGGGISQASAFPIAPIMEYVRLNAFGGPESKLPVIVKAQLGNDAGLVGAANLVDR